MAGIYDNSKAECNRTVPDSKPVVQWPKQFFQNPMVIWSIRTALQWSLPASKQIHLKPLQAIKPLQTISLRHNTSMLL